MRKTMTAIAAALVTIAAAAPAVACGVDACGYGLFSAGGYVEGYSYREHLPNPEEPRYYYVNQGPTYSGPGMYAPVPTYQERAVTGWHGYDYGYYYGYNGGPYGDATSHYYDGMPAAQGPVVYHYGPWRHHRRHSLRYGYGPRMGHYAMRNPHHRMHHGM